jgi:hypothetical protein
MKIGMQMALVAVLLAGCSAPSRFKNDPRAAVVGPDYLDYIVQYPMDRDTQYYYPDFRLAGVTSKVGSSMQSPGFPANVDALLTQTPKPTPAVMESEGKGWPELEHDGIPF